MDAVPSTFEFGLIVYSENDIEDALDLTFSTEDDRFGEVVTVDLKPDGQNIAVTNENKKEYVEYHAPW
jgi:E3 ubiquitin-protein ligase NEDD4